jgi:hypothetical protein
LSEKAAIAGMLNDCTLTLKLLISPVLHSKPKGSFESTYELSAKMVFNFIAD